MARELIQSSGSNHKINGRRDPNNGSEHNSSNNAIRSIANITHSYVVGGREVSDDSSFPWMVGLLDEYGFNFCGGALISSRVILTAAHCVYKKSLQSIRAVIGFNDLDYALLINRNIFKLHEIMVHPLFSHSNWSYDLAILTLDLSRQRQDSSFRSIDPRRNLHPICLPASDPFFSHDLLSPRMPEMSAGGGGGGGGGGEYEKKNMNQTIRYSRIHNNHSPNTAYNNHDHNHHNNNSSHSHNDWPSRGSSSAPLFDIPTIRESYPSDPNSHRRHDQDQQSVLMVAGWGRTSTNPLAIKPSKLHQVTLPLIDQNLCERIWSENHVNEKQLCAGSPGKDSCTYDSGSPLMQLDYVRKKTFLIGITSFGSKRCGDSHKPGVYTRISSYLNWIHEMTSELETGSCR